MRVTKVITLVVSYDDSYTDDPKHWSWNLLLDMPEKDITGVETRDYTVGDQLRANFELRRRLIESIDFSKIDFAKLHIGKYSTPEEVWGPVSLAQLRDGE